MIAKPLNYPMGAIYYSLLIILYNCNIITNILQIIVNRLLL